jgi:poly(beta-D-mannuronate) lyase
MMRRLDFPLALVATLAWNGHAGASSLKPPFDPAYPRQVAGRAAAAQFKCGDVAAPALDMSGLESRYAKDDPTQSKIDPANAAREAARGKVLWDYTMQLGRMADQFMLSNPPRQDIADCVVHHLAAWARADALTKNIEQNHEIGRHQAIMLQAWSLAGMTFAYMKLGDRPHSGPEDRDIQRWLRILSDSVVKEYSDQTSRWYQKRSSNHGLWAGLAVANSGIVLNDRSKLDFGLALLHDGLGAVAADGSLPDEMARGDRAQLYQHFATMAIMGLVAIAEANGRALDSKQQQALLRLLRFDIDAAGKSSAASGAANALPKHVDKSALAWSEIAVCYLQQRDSGLADRIDAYVRTMRPLVHIYYGGSATAAFNPAALPGIGGREGIRRCAPGLAH